MIQVIGVYIYITIIIKVYIQLVYIYIYNITLLYVLYIELLVIIFQGFGVLDLNPGGLDLEERLQLKSCLAADAIFLWRM